jgi:hypothetical protein
VLDTPPSSSSWNDLVYLDTVLGSFTKSLVDVVGLDHAVVRADNSGASYGERFVGVIGGGAGQQGSSNTQGLVAFAGGATPLSRFADIKGWGKAVLIGTDNEGYPQGMTLDQAGYFTMDEGRLITGPNPYPGFYPTQQNNVVQSTFQGNATFVNLDDAAGLLATANTQGNVLSFGVVYSTDYGCTGSTCPCTGSACNFLQENAAAVAAGAHMAVADAQFCNAGGYYGFYVCPDKAVSTVAEPAFMASMLADLRNTPATLGTGTCSGANVTIRRVSFEGITTGNPSDSARATVRVAHN